MFGAWPWKIWNLVQLETSKVTTETPNKIFSSLQTCCASYNSASHTGGAHRGGADSKISGTTTLAFQDFSMVFRDLCLFPHLEMKHYNLRTLQDLYEPCNKLVVQCIQSVSSHEEASMSPELQWTIRVWSGSCNSHRALCRATPPSWVSPLHRVFVH